MIKQHFVYLFIAAQILLILMLFIPWAVFADFTPSDGQAATLVLGQTDFASNSPDTTQMGMNLPSAVAVDPITHKVFVAEQENHRVLSFSSITRLTNEAAAEAVLGQADFSSGATNRGCSVAANTMDSPSGVHIDMDGRLWVADMLNPRVLRFDYASTKANGADADGVLGQPDFTHNASATTQNGMNIPTHVFVTGGGRLWVAEYGNNRVLRFDNAASKSNGAAADGVLGQSNFTTNTPATTQNKMSGLVAVFVDSVGRLWVAEYNNIRVMRFDNAVSKPDGANADGVLGQLNFTSNGYACTQNGMHVPRGVTGDHAGRLFVSDGDNHRVLIFLNAAGLSDGANADFVLGQTNFTTCTANTGGISAISLHTPSKLFYDTQTRVLWVADRYNFRVLLYGTPMIREYLPVVKK